MTSTIYGVFLLSLVAPCYLALRVKKIYSQMSRSGLMNVEPDASNMIGLFFVKQLIESLALTLLIVIVPWVILNDGLHKASSRDTLDIIALVAQSLITTLNIVVADRLLARMVAKKLKKLTSNKDESA